MSPSLTRRPGKRLMSGMPPIPDTRAARPLAGCPCRGTLRGRAVPRRIFRPTGDMCRRRHHADRGSVSLWLVIFAFTTIALLVLVVDGGQTMNAKSRAADIAEQAARAAADDVNVGQLRGRRAGGGRHPN